MTRVRFAPSPTGFLHIGGARTYIFNWLFARRHQGRLILRIDDTDIERSTAGSLQSILEGLEWLELPWDEEHRHSQRRRSHQQAAEALLAKDRAYRDFTEEKTDAERSAGESAGPWLANPGMREMSRQESDRRAAAGERFVLRFFVDRESGRLVEFEDGVYRQQARKITDIEDFALLRGDGSPTYHLASTVDDAELGISHVIRGARALLRELADRLEQQAEFTEESVERDVRGLAAEWDVKPGLIINAARAALRGQSVGPSAFAIFAALGRDTVLRRLRRV